MARALPFISAWDSLAVTVASCHRKRRVGTSATHKNPHQISRPLLGLILNFNFDIATLPPPCRSSQARSRTFNMYVYSIHSLSNWAPCVMAVSQRLRAFRLSPPAHIVLLGIYLTRLADSPTSKYQCRRKGEGHLFLD